MTSGVLEGGSGGGFDAFAASFIAPLPLPGDTDGDGDLDDADLGTAFANYTSPVAPVPEPASMLVMALSATLLLRRR